MCFKIRTITTVHWYCSNCDYVGTVMLNFHFCFLAGSKRFTARSLQGQEGEAKGLRTSTETFCQTHLR